MGKSTISMAMASIAFCKSLPEGKFHGSSHHQSDEVSFHLNAGWMSLAHPQDGWSFRACRSSGVSFPVQDWTKSVDLGKLKPCGDDSPKINHDEPGFGRTGFGRMMKFTQVYNHHPFKEGGRSKCKLAIRRCFGGDVWKCMLTFFLIVFIARLHFDRFVDCNYVPPRFTDLQLFSRGGVQYCNLHFTETNVRTWKKNGLILFLYGIYIY